MNERGAMVNDNERGKLKWPIRRKSFEPLTFCPLEIPQAEVRAFTATGGRTTARDKARNLAKCLGRGSPRNYGKVNRS